MSNISQAIVLSSMLALSPTVILAQEAGLAERRAIAAYTKDVWPALEKSIQQAAGYPVVVTLDHKTLALPGYANRHISVFSGKLPKRL